MIDLRKLRRASARIAGGLVLMVVGARLLSQYLAYRYPAFEPVLRDTDDFLLGALWLCLLSAVLLRPPEDRADSRSEEVSPRWSGTLVVLITGVAAALFVGEESVGTGDYWAPALIVVGTIVAAILVWRFASRHADEIGEARFVE